jgi:hypothetical protein
MDQSLEARGSQSSVGAFWNEELRSPFIAAGRNGLAGYRAVRLAGMLRLHPAFIQLNLAGWLINLESHGNPPRIRQPILITKNGVLISGFPDWHAAVRAGQAKIECTEFGIDDDEARQPRMCRAARGWKRPANFRS